MENEVICPAYQKIKDLIKVYNRFCNDEVRFHRIKPDGEFKEHSEVYLTLEKSGEYRCICRFELIYETSDNKLVIHRESYEKILTYCTKVVDLNPWYDRVYNQIILNSLFAKPGKFRVSDGVDRYIIPISDLISKGYNESKKQIDDK